MHRAHVNVRPDFRNRPRLTVAPIEDFFRGRQLNCRIIGLKQFGDDVDCKSAILDATTLARVVLTQFVRRRLVVPTPRSAELYACCVPSCV
jgi:hypothetical protein